MNKAPKKLGDFTITVQVIPISLMAVAIGAIASPVAVVSAEPDQLFYERVLLWPLHQAAASPAANHLGACGRDARSRRPDRWTDGALWLG